MEARIAAPVYIYIYIIPRFRLRRFFNLRSKKRR